MEGDRFTEARQRQPPRPAIDAAAGGQRAENIVVTNALVDDAVMSR
jgi:hypothetical protein